jgi:hypothetical protein
LLRRSEHDWTRKALALDHAVDEMPGKNIDGRSASILARCDVEPNTATTASGTRATHG